MPRFVDEEQVAGIVEILSLEVFCPELQLDFVVAHPTGIHHAFAEVQRDLLRWSEGHTTVSGDGDIAVGSIIVPLHVNCRASSANAAMLKKAMISDAIMLARNIDRAPYHFGSDAARRVDVIFLDCEIGNFDGHHRA